MGPKLISVVRLPLPSSCSSWQAFLPLSAEWDGAESAQKGMVIGQVRCTRDRNHRRTCNRCRAQGSAHNGIIPPSGAEQVAGRATGCFPSRAQGGRVLYHFEAVSRQLRPPAGVRKVRRASSALRLARAGRCPLRPVSRPRPAEWRVDMSSRNGASALPSSWPWRGGLRGQVRRCSRAALPA
jgi:hypothetical protein